MMHRLMAIIDGKKNQRIRLFVSKFFTFAHAHEDFVYSFSLLPITIPLFFFLFDPESASPLSRLARSEEKSAYT